MSPPNFDPPSQHTFSPLNTSLSLSLSHHFSFKPKPKTKTKEFQVLSNQRRKTTMSCSVAVSNSTMFSLSSSCHFSLSKRKRPDKLDIPVANLTIELQPAAPSPTTAKDVVEVEGDGFSVYCKKGGRKHMEDRYSASVDLHGESKQVTSNIMEFWH